MFEFLRTFLRSPSLKLFLIAFLIVLLMVPLFLAGALIDERSNRAQEVRSEIGHQWGPKQTLIGPFVAVPYVVQVVGWDNGKRVEQQRERFAIFTPEVLDVSGQADTKILHRSIYDVPVYAARLKLSGRFGAAHIAEVDSETVQSVRWNDAKFVLSLSEVAGLKSVAKLRIDDKTDIAFAPSTGLAGRSALNTGIHARLGEAPAIQYGPDKEFGFEVNLDFNGSVALNVAPVAKETRVSLKSNWRSPSFQGAFLPSEREIGPDGFDASWKVPQLARNVPDSWSLSEAGLDRLEPYVFGVGFLDPVDFYTLVNRAIKYGLMFLATAFMAVFCLEVISGRRVHAVQYLFTGLGLIFFYVLLLSLAEHIGFDTAYLLASSAMALMVATYVGAVLQSLRRGIVMVVILGLLFALLYFILRLEDYALLVGALLGFVALAITMFTTLRVDWSGRSPKAVPVGND